MVCHAVVQKKGSNIHVEDLAAVGLFVVHQERTGHLFQGHWARGIEGRSMSEDVGRGWLATAPNVRRGHERGRGRGISRWVRRRRPKRPQLLPRWGVRIPAATTPAYEIHNQKSAPLNLSSVPSRRTHSQRRSWPPHNRGTFDRNRLEKDTEMNEKTWPNVKTRSRIDSLSFPGAEVAFPQRQPFLLGLGLGCRTCS